MGHHKFDVLRVPRHRKRDAVEVLVTAFRDYPLMRYVFSSSDDADHLEALRAMFGFSCELRFQLDWPLLGIANGGELLGIAGVTMPEEPTWPEALQRAYAQLESALSDDASRRFDAYDRLRDRYRPEMPHHYLPFIGVRPEAQGRGCGQALLEAVHELVAAHPASTGVGLDTQSPANVRWYERFGYEVVGADRLNGLGVWCLFRTGR